MMVKLKENYYVNTGPGVIIDVRQEQGRAVMLINTGSAGPARVTFDAPATPESVAAEINRQIDSWRR